MRSFFFSLLASRALSVDLESLLFFLFFAPFIMSLRKSLSSRLLWNSLRAGVRSSVSSLS